MITINSLLPHFELQNYIYLKEWLNSVIVSEGKVPGDIQYIFCDDDYLLGINQSFLDHDTLTDIITFPTSVSEEVVSGEIFISVPRVRENATLNKFDFELELSRVMVHGVLHLLGFEDGSPAEKLEMRSKEDYYLNLQP